MSNHINPAQNTSLKILKEQRGNTLLVKLVGPIEESVDFQSQIGAINAATTKEIFLLLKEVTRINSVGVKAWIKYFQSVAAQGVTLVFHECSTAVVEQINLISNFVCGGRVESIYVPFCCGACNTELLGLFRSEDLLTNRLELPELPCGKCSGKATFDDIPDEYFAFLKRAQK